MKDVSGNHYCRLCGREAFSYVWGGCECPSCGSVSATSLPTQSELQEYYEGFNEKYDGGHTGGGNLLRYANRYLAFLKDHIPNGTLIDIGSSSNPFPNIAANAGFSVTVMDYVKPRDLDSRVTFVEGNLNDNSFLRNCRVTYDIVTAWAVLEHVPNPKLACSILSGLCKPGGTIILSTPEIGTFLTDVSMGRSGWFHPPMHLHLVSPMAIHRVFAQNNCDLIKWGRLELNSWRYIARYGVGLTEAIIGVFMKRFFSHKWGKARIDKKQRFKGITYFVLRRGG